MGINQKLLNVMQKVERIPKNGYNDFHKYHYVTEADASEHIRKAFIEEGIAFYCTCEEQERNGEYTKVKMRFTLVDTESKESLESIIWGEGQDKGDKGLYKAYTGAVKYFLMKTFLIPTGDDPEAEDGKTAKPPQSKPVKADKTQKDNLATEAQRKKLYAMCNAANKDIKTWVPQQVGRNISSTTELTQQEIQELFKKLEEILNPKQTKTR